MAQNYSLMTERWEIHMNGKTLYVQRSWDDDGPITSSEHIPLTTQPEKRGKEVAVIHRWFSGQYIEFRNELLYPCATGADYICIYNHRGVEKDGIWCHAPVAKIKRVSTSKSQKVLEGWLAQPVEDELFMAMLYAAPV